MWKRPSSCWERALCGNYWAYARTKCPAFDNNLLLWHIRFSSNLDLPRHWRAQRTSSLHPFCVVHVSESFLVFLCPNTSVLSVSKSWHMKDTFIRERGSDVRNRNRRIYCSYTIDKKQPVEHNHWCNWCTLVVIRKTCDLAFSGVSVRSSKESLNLPLLFSETLLRAGGGWELTVYSASSDTGDPSRLVLFSTYLKTLNFRPILR